MKKAYSEKQLQKGMSVEKEHSNNPYVQRKIATDHLKENKDYYNNYNGKGKEYLVSSSNKKNFC